MIKETMRQTWVEIDLGALENNIREIKEQVGSSEIIGVVKADAYGHGSVRCAEIMRRNGIHHFAVATIDEALELRRAGIEDDILVLGLVPDMCADLVLRYNLTILLCSEERAEVFAEAARKAEREIQCMIALDSGMGRIGYRVETREEKEAACDAIERIDEMEGLRIIGLISHFSSSDEEDKNYTDRQLREFYDFYEMLASDGVGIGALTIANSAAVTDCSKTYFDYVRPGIILYGLYPSDKVCRDRLTLEPVMSVKANIVYLKTVPAGTAISYGRRFVTERESKIATISLGYADGYSRTLSGKAEVLVHGKRVPVVGNICMDQCMIDVTDIPDVSRCDEVVILGKQGEEEITAEELADKIGTIHYEILCDFGLRLPKVYK